MMAVSETDVLRTREKRCSRCGNPTSGRRRVTFYTQPCPPVLVHPAQEVTFPLASPETSEIPLEDVKV